MCKVLHISYSNSDFNYDIWMGNGWTFCIERDIDLVFKNLKVSRTMFKGKMLVIMNQNVALKDKQRGNTEDL